MKFLTNIFSQWGKTVSAMNKGDFGDALKIVEQNFNNRTYMNSFSMAPRKDRMAFLEMLVNANEDRFYKYMMDCLLAEEVNDPESQKGDKFYGMVRNGKMGKRGLALLTSIQNPQYMLEMLSKPRVVGTLAEAGMGVELLEFIRTLPKGLKQKAINICNGPFGCSTYAEPKMILQGLRTPVTQARIDEFTRATQKRIIESSQQFRSEQAQNGILPNSNPAPFARFE